jgi:CDP-diacylglycerol--glycerol-3-phosphate 3-phosphatidyltransferase
LATKIAGKFESTALATPANAITAVRLLATPPVLILIVHLGVSWGAALAWAAVASTDFLDGWVARRQGATTSGAFLDPLADKVLVLGALGALAATGLAISAYRSVVARQGISVPARPLAKGKTAAQDLAVGFILIPLNGLHHRGVGETLLWISVALALISGAQYLLDSRRPALPPRPAGDDLPPA